ncbi:MAG: DUF1015 domain-containing protein [Brevinematia bacterium]
MDIKPFKGLLPEGSIVEKVVSPPYDVVTREEVRKLIAENKLSFLRITRSDAEFGNEVGEYEECVYKKAREMLVDFIDEKVLLPDSSPSFYLISQNKNGRVQNGIYCLVRCEDYERGLIKKHELTHFDKEEDRTRHIFETKADTGPVFLFFRNNGDFKSLIGEFQKDYPDYSFEDSEGVNYKLWKISMEEDILSIRKYFENIDSFYIADGHHRAASAVNVWNKNGRKENSYGYFMAVVFPSDEVTILSYNRVLLNMKISEKRFLEELSKNFDLVETKNAIPQRKGEIGIFIGNKSFLLHFRDKTDDILNGLDVSILQNEVFSKILGIEDPRNSKDIAFMGGKDSEKIIIKMVKEKKAIAVFFLYPVDINDLMKVSDMGRIMPPKSTWFEPKLKDGLVTYLLDEI